MTCVSCRVSLSYAGSRIIKTHFLGLLGGSTHSSTKQLLSRLESDTALVLGLQREQNRYLLVPMQLGIP